MPERASVTSIEALEDFRSKLVVYLSKARPTLEEVTADVLRTRVWLENDQRLRWEAEVKRRTRLFEQAQQALFSSKISNLRPESSAEQLMFHRAKRALDEAQQKLRVVKQWNREYDNRLQPLLKQTEKLHTILAHDMGLALAYLTEAITALNAYAEAGLPATLAPATGGETGAATPGNTTETQT
jgi:hypothetical protein